MSVYVCTTCGSWHIDNEALKIHKKKKECLKIVQDRMAAKKLLRAQSDAERKAKISGVPDVVNSKEPIKDAPAKAAPAPKEEIETKVDPAKAEGTSNSEEATADAEVSVFDTDAFKAYLVEHCDVKIQKVSRMKEDKLKTTFEEYLPGFTESLDS